MPHPRRIAVVAALVSLVAVSASAQETRAEIARQAREQKSKDLKPYVPNRVEATLFRIEDRYLMERIFNPPRGLFVRFGGMPQGAGLAAGPAYRRSNHVYDLTGSSAVSMRGYWELAGSVGLPHLAGDRASIRFVARRRSLPQEDFFGLGPSSTETAQTSFALKETSLALEAGVAPTDWFRVSASVGRESPRVSSGKDSRFPSIEDVFADVVAPGLAHQPDFLRARFGAVIDVADRALGPPSGGVYAASYEAYQDRDRHQYSFRQWTMDVRQYVPIVSGARSLVFRGFATGVRPLAGNEAPFFYQPTLGGPYSVRSLVAYRLRDRHVVLLQAEYRFELNAFMTGAVFYDAGSVTARMRDVTLRGMRHDAGFGLRLGFMSKVSLRADVAFGSEGPRLVFKFADVF